MTKSFEFRCACLPLVVCDHCMSTVWADDMEALARLKEVQLEELAFYNELMAKYGPPEISENID